MREHPIKVGIFDEEYDGIIEYEIDGDGDISLYLVYAYIQIQEGCMRFNNKGKLIKYPDRIIQKIDWDFIDKYQKVQWEREIKQSMFIATE